MMNQPNAVEIGNTQLVFPTASRARSGSVMFVLHVLLLGQALPSSRQLESLAQDSLPKDCTPLSEACEDGDPEACADLGESFILLGARKCSIVRTDPEQAARFYRMACDGGSADGCLGLGYLFSTEEWGLTDPGATVKAYQKSGVILRGQCGPSNPSACRTLGGLIDRGHVDGGSSEASKYFAMAVKRYSEMCAGGTVDACVSLANIFSYYSPDTPDRRDSVREVDALVQACMLGSYVSCDKAGEAYRDGLPSLEQDRARALSFFERGCALDFYASCRSSADLHATEPSRPNDLERALERYEKACLLGSCYGCQRAAEMYGAGEGVTRNAMRAKELLEQPCVDP